MNAPAASTVPAPEPPDAAAPYPPSILDRLLARIDGLPGHGWWVYPLLLIGSVAYVHGVRWAMGRLPLGTLDATSASFVLYGPYALAAIHYLDRVGRRAIAEFRPALDLTDAEVDARRYELVTLPAGRIFPFVAAGAVVAIATIAFSPASVIAGFGSTPLEVLVAGGPLTIFGYAGFALLLYHTFRQLRLVARIHREATRIDLYDDAPLYAFSRLTAQTGLAYVGIGYYSLTVNWQYLADNPVSLGVSLLNFVVGAACFLLPLLGIHGRLVAEKSTLTRAANRRLHLATSELYRRIDETDLVGMAEVNDAVAGVIASRELITKLPTWPWPPQVLRGFVTALLLPIVVWIVTRVLGEVVH